MNGEFASPDQCRACKSQVWSFTIPYNFRLDPEPLNPMTEFEALMAGRRTYQLKPFLNTFWAIWRSAKEIKTTIPGTFVLATHFHRTTPITELPEYWPDRAPALTALHTNEGFPF
jgi:hypothetical protein